MKCDDCGEEGHKAGWPFCPGKIMRKTEPKYAPMMPVPNVPNSVPNRTESLRVGEWKKKNAERVRAYQRDYMRKRRKG